MTSAPIRGLETLPGTQGNSLGVQIHVLRIQILRKATQDERSTRNVITSATDRRLHTLPVETVLSHLESTRSGLASAEANRRLGVYGRNELQVTRRTTAWKLLLEQFQNVLIVILLAATVLSAFIGEIGLMAGTSLAGLPLPLSAVQLQYVNLATDGLPALALAVDPPEPDLMRRRS